jgi:hypothetical protein
MLSLLASIGMDKYVLFGTFIFLTSFNLKQSSIPCVQQSTATAYGAPKKFAISFSKSEII